MGPVLSRGHCLACMLPQDFRKLKRRHLFFVVVIVFWLRHDELSSQDEKGREEGRAKKKWHWLARLTLCGVKKKADSKHTVGQNRGIKPQKCLACWMLEFGAAATVTDGVGFAQVAYDTNTGSVCTTWCRVTEGWAFSVGTSDIPPAFRTARATDVQAGCAR